MASTVDKRKYKEILFIEEYLQNGFNATAAYKAAGYICKKKTSSRIRTDAHLLLAKPNIQSDIKKRIKEKISNTEEMTIKWLEEVQRIAFSDLRNVAEWGGSNVRLKESGEIEEKHARAISEVSESQHGAKIKLASKEKALELLGRYLSILVDNNILLDKKERLNNSDRRERILKLQKELKIADSRKKRS